MIVNVTEILIVIRLAERFAPLRFAEMTNELRPPRNDDPWEQRAMLGSAKTACVCVCVI